MIEIGNNSNFYQVGKQVAKTGDYRLYLCNQGGTGRQCLLQIATSIVSIISFGLFFPNNFNLLRVSIYFFITIFVGIIISWFLGKKTELK